MSKTMSIKFGREPVDFDSSEKVNKRYKYVEWGKGNDYPYKLIDMVQRSAVHQGIVNSKVSYITGGGFITDNPQVSKVIDNGTSDYTLNEVVERCSYDFEIFNMFAFRGVWNRAGDRVAYLEHVDMDKLRESAYDDNIWLYSDDWSESRQTREKTGFKTFKTLDLNDKNGEFIVVYKSPSKRNRDTEGVYSTPVYSGGLDAIQTDIEISRFHLQEILNGFSGGTIINIPTGVPTTEEEKADARKFKDNVTGSLNAGEVFLNFSNGTEDEIKVVQINGNDLDKRYEMLDKSTMQKIIISHSVTSPILMGIKTEGQIGGTTELDVSFQIFKNTYIKNRQKPLNEVFTYVLNKCFNIEGVLELEEAKPPFEESVVVEQPQVFAKKDKSIDEAIAEFAKCGVPKSECNIVGGVEMPQDFDSNAVANFEKEQIEQLFDEITSIAEADLQNTASNIIGLLDRGDSIATISSVLGSSIDEVVKKVKALQEKGYISEDLSVTERGKRLIQIVNTEIDDFEVRYTYEKRAGVPGGDIIPTSRDFCRELIALDRAYTREEIDIISARSGRDVWRLRGGWYHNPETDVTTPFCRHAWKYVLIKK